MKPSQKIFRIIKTPEGNKIYSFRYTSYKMGNYVDPIDFHTKSGLVAKFISFKFIKDHFAKENYTFTKRIIWIKNSMAADVLDRNWNII